MVAEKLTVVQVLPEFDEGGVRDEALEFAVYPVKKASKRFQMAKAVVLRRCCRGSDEPCALFFLLKMAFEKITVLWR